MTEQFLSEIRMMSFDFPPKGWALCNGQTLAISQSQALFALLGITYGGNGTSTFQLPNLQGRVPISYNNSFALGQVGGEPTHTLTTNEIPTHLHLINASSAATGGNANPSNRFLGGATNVYAPPGNQTAMNPASVAATGGNQPHDNMQPYLVINFCIALSGIFPSRN